MRIIAGHRSVPTGIAVLFVAALLAGCGTETGSTGASGSDTVAGGQDAAANDGASADAGGASDSGAADTGASSDSGGTSGDSISGDSGGASDAGGASDSGGATDVGGGSDSVASDASGDAGGASDSGDPADAVEPSDGGGASDGGGGDTAGGADAGDPGDAGGVNDVGGGADAGDPGDAGGFPPGCCGVDADCTGSAICYFGPFNAGKCMPTDALPKGKCWTDAQCGQGETCEGGIACGCKAFCKAMDTPGTCKGPGAKTCSVGQGADTDCGADAFCALPAGQCAGTGTCAPKPGGCAMIYDPVCGCDGKTHGNACSAASSGVNVVAKGECPAVNKCLTVKCGDGNACTDDTCDPATGVCSYVPQAGVACDDGNACTTGDVCAEESGKAYCSAGAQTQCPTPAPCELVSCNPKSGQCETKVDPSCGGGGGAKCSIGLGAPTIDCGIDGYCKLPDGSCTGFGTCEQKPQACIALYEPVCGCSGKTHGNSCEAGAQGDNWGSKGACGGGGGGGSGCCKQDGDCKTGLCAGTMCKDPNEAQNGYCWTDAQCAGGKCVGASICPCGANCLLPDKLGKCSF